MPEQIRRIHRKVRHILFGMFLNIAPLLSLLLAGLIFGLLSAVPIYLIVRFACRWGQWRRGELSSSHKYVPDLFAFPLGGISLATRDPIWFQIETTLIAVFVLARWLVSGRSSLADIEPFPPTGVIGETPAGIMKNIFITSLIAAPVINLWLALQFSETAWLLFRTLGFFLWIAGFAILGTWFAARRAEQEAG